MMQLNLNLKEIVDKKTQIVFFYSFSYVIYSTEILGFFPLIWIKWIWYKDMLVDTVILMTLLYYLFYIILLLLYILNSYYAY
jgi:hypothetical protein